MHDAVGRVCFWPGYVEFSYPWWGLRKVMTIGNGAAKYDAWIEQPT